VPQNNQSDGQSDWTTITVKPSLRDRLKAQKRGGESYSDLFERMLNDFEGDEIDEAPTNK